MPITIDVNELHQLAIKYGQRILSAFNQLSWSHSLKVFFLTNEKVNITIFIKIYGSQVA